MLLKMKALYQLRYVRQLLPISGKDIGQVFPKCEILKGIVLGKYGVAAGFKGFIPEMHRLPVKADIVDLKSGKQAGQNLYKSRFSGSV